MDLPEAIKLATDYLHRAPWGGVEGFWARDRISLDNLMIALCDLPDALLVELLLGLGLSGFVYLDEGSREKSAMRLSRDSLYARFQVSKVLRLARAEHLDSRYQLREPLRGGKRNHRRKGVWRGQN